MGFFDKKISDYCNGPTPSLTPEQMEHRNELHKIARQALKNQHIIKQNNKWFYTVKYEQEGLTYLNDIIDKESNVFIPILETVSEELVKEVENNAIITTLNYIPGYKITKTFGWFTFDYSYNLLGGEKQKQQQKNIIMSTLTTLGANAFINCRYVILGNGFMVLSGDVVLVEEE